MMPIRTALTQYCEHLLPRMLTQICRDPGSPAYGSFDRNWWHYKIRDFSSLIIQQGGYSLYCASQSLDIPETQKKSLLHLAKGSCLFWNQRAKKFRSFEEYYPWEQGYPPVAFSTLAIAKLVSEEVCPLEDVLPGLKIAASQLQSRFESKATNQQVAGTAALCWIRKIAPELIAETQFQSICTKTFACQHEEGWFMEYGGPDLGYLSVTMDCLWDAYDATHDERFKISATKALKFISLFATRPFRGAGMHNARNTDYIVPYGIARFLEDSNHNKMASEILSQVYHNADSPNHFLHAIDDRYYCHYIGHSLFRAIPLLDKVTQEASKVQSSTHIFLPGTGHWLNTSTSSGCASLISTKKGGIATFIFDKNTATDFGWVISNGKREWVSHWWADFWQVEQSEDVLSISGIFTPHKETESTPFKHVVLRGLSLVFGNKIIGLLKSKMIFKQSAKSPYTFNRIIQFSPECVTITDTFLVGDNMTFSRAPRSSKRHVASADSYQLEDSIPVSDGIHFSEDIQKNDHTIKVTTQYKAQS